MDRAWTPDPAFDAGSVAVAELVLCQARLQDDARFPWLVLVPARDGAVEITDLAPADRQTLMAEIAWSAHALKAAVRCHKLNIGALGNVVPQLHVHVGARRPDDAAWPGPVWGSGPAQPRAPAERNRLIRKIRAALDAAVADPRS